MQYELQPAQATDKDAIRQLNDRCYREVVEAQFGTWDEELQRDFFERKWNPTHFQKIMCSGQLVGVLSSWTRQQEIFLAEIQIDPEHQGQGLGTAIVRDILTTALSLGVPVKLQVLKKNRAKSLYERLGFVVTGVTETHFQMEGGRGDASPTDESVR